MAERLEVTRTSVDVPPYQRSSVGFSQKLTARSHKKKQHDYSGDKQVYMNIMNRLSLELQLLLQIDENKLHNYD